MWRFNEAELYCVKTNILRTSELMQFEMGMSTRRYLPPTGTAGFERCCVNGKRREPAPPPRITASRLCFAAGIYVSPVCLGFQIGKSIDAKRHWYQELFNQVGQAASL